MTTRGSTRPLIIVGLDGATFDVIDPLVARGELPTLAKLMETGWRTELLSTLPPATLPAWTSFLTGAPPGRHGLVDMFLPRTPGYDIEPASGEQRRVPTLLATLAHRGLKVASLGVPGTYPPEPLPDGLCIAGFDAPGVSRAGKSSVWPRSLWRDLDRLGGWRYATFNELSRKPGREAALTQALLADLDTKERVILALHARAAWDVFFVHLQASDTAAHHLWHTYDADSPRAAASSQHTRDLLPSVYRRLDRLLGRLLAQAPQDAHVLVVSDHGMGGAGRTAVHLNRMLSELGLLHFVPTGQRALLGLAGSILRAGLGRLPTAVLGTALRYLPGPVARRALRVARGAVVDYGRSQAFSYELDYAPSIWINRAGSFAHGQVNSAAARVLTQQITNALLALRDPDRGSPLVQNVYPREHYVHGPAAASAPDLLVEPAWPGGYRPSFLTSLGPGPTVRRLQDDELAAPKGSGMPGVHRREGIVLLAGPDARQVALPSLTIWQAGALVYTLLGEEPPEHIAPVPAFATDARDNLAVHARLRSLGYID